jgi:hypothetical protein
MADNLNHAIDHALSETNYNLDGFVFPVDGDSDTWYIVFMTPPDDATLATMQVLYIQVFLGGDMVSMSLLKKENMCDIMSNRLMNHLIDVINVSGEDSDDTCSNTPEVTN